jgi:hypothetical protein
MRILRCLPLFIALLVHALSSAAAAQEWNDARAIDLATRATERRVAQIADPALASYSAMARGTIVFQGKLGERGPLPPVTVKATEIASRLYWSQPGRSRQVLVGLRDTSFFPENIGYYQDRYGIIQNNFPDVIRLGDGRDVRDVPHPFSRQGLLVYDFAVRDSSTMTLTDQTIDFYELAVRPKDSSQPRAIGTIFITRADAAVVRMKFTFTRSAYIRDERNDALTVTLENALVEGRFWLPRLQQLDLIRSARAIDFPVTGMIRARWEVCCYEVNIDLSRITFAGPEILSSPAAVLREYRWETDIMESIPPDVRILTPPEIRELREQAAAMVQAEALNRTRGAALSARRFSDFLRVNRVEGVAAGAGGRIRVGGGLSLSLGGRYGFSDKEPKGRASIKLDRVGHPTFELFAERDYQDAGLVQERSLTMNSIAAPAFGSDYTSLFDARSVGVNVNFAPLGSLQPEIGVSYQTNAPLAVNLNPVSGSFAGALPAMQTQSMVLKLSATASGSGAPLGFSDYRWSLASEVALFGERALSLTLNSPRYGRLYGDLELSRPVGASSLRLSLFAATVHSNVELPPQKLIFLGGPVSAPGYDFHELAGATGAAGRAELRIPVPFFSVSLGRYGRSPARATLAPFAGAAYVSDVPEFSIRRSGFHPYVGVGTSVFWDLLRMDVARGLNDGRFTFSVDVMKELWGIL